MTKPTKDNMNLEQDAVNIVDDATAKRLSKLATEQIHLQNLVDEKQEELVGLEKALREVSTVKLPLLMDEVGMRSFTLSDGQQISIKEIVKASISEKNRDAAHRWLRDEGHGALIKNQVVVTFGRGEEEKADQFTAEINKSGYVYDRKERVHSQTLSAFVKEQLNDGQLVPMDLLGVFQFHQAVVKK